MLVSVIIPTYNRANFLKEAIDSVLNQDYKNFELIVVDDGSTDETTSVLKGYYDKIKYIRIPHQGVSRARNVGIEQAKGGLIAFLDSDDLWMPKKLSIQVEFFKKHLDALVCQTEEIWIRNGRRVNPKKYHIKPSGMIFEQCLKRCMVSTSSVMVRRSLFESIGVFDESFYVCEDYEIWLRVSARYPIYLLREALVIKRGGHSDQLSKTPCLDKWRISAIEKLLSKNTLSPSQRHLAIKEMTLKCNIYGGGCIKRGRLKEGLYYLNLPKKYTQSLP